MSICMDCRHWHQLPGVENYEQGKGRCDHDGDGRRSGLAHVCPSFASERERLCCDEAMAGQVVRSMEEAANNRAQFRSIRIHAIRECADLLEDRARSYDDQRSEYVRATDGCAMTLRRWADRLVAAYAQGGEALRDVQAEIERRKGTE